VKKSGTWVYDVGRYSFNFTSKIGLLQLEIVIEVGEFGLLVVVYAITESLFAIELLQVYNWKNKKKRYNIFPIFNHFRECNPTRDISY